MLIEALLSERFTIPAEDPSDIVSELGDARLIRDQTLPASRRQLMDGAGAGGAIDRVALNVMRDAVHDVVDVIRRMRSSRLGLIIECGERRVDLRWRDGFISASFRVTETASYSRGKLRLDSAGEGLSTRGLRGKRARDVQPTDI
jgi:hypothetical protein